MRTHENIKNKLIINKLMDLLPSRGYADPEVLTIHIQREFIPVGAELVAGLTAICAVVCFVQCGND